jgi:hypothetical protein
VTDDSGVRRTSPHGVPVAVGDFASRPIRATSEMDAIDPLDLRIDARVAALFPSHFDAQLTATTQKKFRRVWVAVVVAAAGSAGSMWAGVRSALDDARSEGADKLRIQVIERDAERAATEARAAHERLRFEIDSLRSEIYYRPAMPRRRDDQPDLPTTGASPRKTTP